MFSNVSSLRARARDSVAVRRVAIAYSRFSLIHVDCSLARHEITVAARIIFHSLFFTFFFFVPLYSLYLDRVFFFR